MVIGMMSGGFAGRMADATAKEKADATTLTQDYECRVSLFGQVQLPEEFRQLLHKHQERLFVRWLPDLLVFRRSLFLAGRTECMWLVDSKTGRQDTPRWVLEKAAHEAHRLQRVALGLPIVYIWPDGCSCSYVEDLLDEVLIEGPRNGRGSGTPYWLVSKGLTRPLDDVFGKRVTPLEGLPA